LQKIWDDMVLDSFRLYVRSSGPSPYVVLQSQRLLM
jgi:hypothetical protein